MLLGPKEDIKKFIFRHLHPQVKMGTASDRYAGWLGQIYTEERYHGRISSAHQGGWGNTPSLKKSSR